MFCSNCGYKLEDGVKFCPNCGTSQPKTENTQPVTEIPIATQQKTDTDEQFQSSVKIGFVQAMKLYFENLLNFKGRATRSEYWWSFLFNIVLWGIILGVLEFTSYDDSERCLFCFMIFFTSSIRVRRLHDVGLFGFSEILIIPSTFIFLITGKYFENNIVIPGLSLIVLLIGGVLSWIFACKKSLSKMNKWGVHIRMQSKEQNTVPVTSKRAWRNVGLSLVSTVILFVVGILLQNMFNSSSVAVTSAEITQSESGQVGNEQSVEQSSGNIRSHWTDDYPVGQWCERENKQCYIFKKDAQNRIYMVFNADDWFRDILRLYIYTDKGNSVIQLSRPPVASMPSDERKNMANRFIPVVKKHIRKPYESFVEAIKDDSRQLLLETAVIKLGYRTGTKYESRYDSINGRSITVPTLGQVRDPSQDMHIRPYKIVRGDATGKTDISPFNNRPYEIIEYYGEF